MRSGGAFDTSRPSSAERQVQAARRVRVEQLVGTLPRRATSLALLARRAYTERQHGFTRGVRARVISEIGLRFLFTKEDTTAGQKCSTARALSCASHVSCAAKY